MPSAYFTHKTIYRAQETSEIGLKERRWLEVFESTLKYMTLLLVSQYRKDKVVDLQIQKCLGGLTQPSLGTYSNIFRSLLKFYKTSDLWWIKELNVFFDDSIDDQTFNSLKTLSNVIEYKVPKNAKSYKQLLDMMVIYRNKAIGHGVTADENVYMEEILPGMERIITNLFERVSFLLNLSILEPFEKQTDKEGTWYSIRFWNGPEIRTKNKQSLPYDVNVGHTYVEVKNTEDEQDVSYLLDLFPFCFATVQDYTELFAFLNNAKKSKFDYLSYHNGERFSVPTGDVRFQEIQSSLELKVEEGGVGLPEHMMHLLEISDEAQDAYSKAMAILQEDKETAIRFLDHAVEKSPAFREAIIESVNIRVEDNSFEDAHQMLIEYIEIVPNDPQMILKDAEILINMSKTKSAEDRIREAEQLDINNPEIESLKNKLEIASKKVPPLSHDKRLILPYEFLSGLFLFQNMQKNEKWTKIFLSFAVTFLTLTIALGFWNLKDIMGFIMALTIFSMGCVWAIVIWATYRMRKILRESVNNFSAFLYSSKDISSDKKILNMLIPVFGFYPLCKESSLIKRIKYMLGFLKMGWKRILFSLTFALLCTFAFFKITILPVLQNSFFCFLVVFVFLQALSFGYLLTCLLCYQYLLKQISFQKIQFSIVQHPKLSIRYLSLLCRRISYPLLLIYISFTFTLYLGPFRTNIICISVMTLLLFFICYMYWKSIFLVRRVLIQNKWRLISQFSIHFTKPFNTLIKEGKKKQLDEINDLTEIRNYIDSISVWPEKRLKLLMSGSMYLLVLCFATIGLSNFMTRGLVPSIIDLWENKLDNSKKISRKNKSINLNSVNQLNIDIHVEGVDDSFLIAFDDSLKGLSDKAYWHVGNKFVENTNGTSIQNRFRRCDWSSGQHGNMKVSIPIVNEKHILMVAYNKTFHGKLLMGGGKASYILNASVNGNVLIDKRVFIRTNKKEIMNVWYIKLFKDGNELKYSIEEGNHIKSPELINCIDWLKSELIKEPDTIDLDL
jgi:tetratricopeptide (TPR) repeat protein